MSSFKRASSLQPAAAGGPPALTHPYTSTSVPTSGCVPVSVSVSVSTTASTPAEAAAVEPVAVSGRGVRPWVSHQHVVSCGLRELDGILGGGHVLGTSLAIEEDAYSPHTRTLLGYAMAEGVSQDHSVLVITCAPAEEFERESILDHMPYNLSTSDEQEAPPISVQGDTQGAGLSIAWQYAKYLSHDTNPVTRGGRMGKSVSVVSQRFCCSFDLSRRLQEPLFEGNPITVISLADLPQTRRASAPAALDVLVSAVTRFLETNAGKPRRILMPDLQELTHTISLCGPHAARALTTALLQITQMIRQPHTQAALTLSYCASESPQWLCRCVRAVSDCVLCVESFVGRVSSVAPEYRDLVGFLIVKKMQTVKALAPHRPDYQRYGLRRDRRKLFIEPLHLPPEDSRALSSATSATHNIDF